MGATLTKREDSPTLENPWSEIDDSRVSPKRPDANEFERLYKQYRARVYSLCLCMTSNRDDAEDLTQETFVRLYCKLDSFRGESSLYAWLRRVAINVVLLRFQKAYWRKETSLEELTGFDPLDTQETPREFGGPDGDLQGAIDRIDLERAIEQLPPGSREVLLLHDVEGYQHDEISAQMGCSRGTSKSQLHKARGRVRELLIEPQRAGGPGQVLEGGAALVRYSPVSRA